MATTRGQKKLNTQDVRKGTIRFILSFIVLTAISFLSVFFFFKSSQLQNRETRKQMDEYYSMLQRNNILQMQMDTIYKRMGLIGEAKVVNDIALRQIIFNEMNECRSIIGKDSADNLKHYSILLEDLKPILDFKVKLGEVKDEEREIRRKLDICGIKINKANAQMKKINDPNLKGIYKNQNR